ncbi:hypothetical protein MMC13_002954 [Lambiella insularis]|nr:hypothetical protein [Lambiella insularis]
MPRNKGRKRSYAQYAQGKEQSPNVGLGATLAHLQNPAENGETEPTTPSLIDDSDSGYPPEDWKIVERRPKRHKGKHAKQSDKQVPAKKDNRPAVTFAELHKLHSSLKISDLQGLVLYCLADGVSPQWISVRHHAQVRKVVVLFVPGLEKGMFDGHIELPEPATEDGDSDSPSITSTTGQKVTQLPDLQDQTLLQESSTRSPDDYLPIPLAKDQLSDPLKPLADMFSHLLPVNAPGDDKYYKVHSPLPAMLVAPIPKSQEEKKAEKDKDGPRPPRVGGSWKDERTSVTAFLASNEDLVENEYALHPARLLTDEDKDENVKRREAAKQTTENGWVDTIVKGVEDATTPEADFQSGSLTVGRMVLALDCEMCQVEGDEYALTRISIVNWDGEVVMDELVMPEKPITNYLTQYSGITATRLASVTTDLSNIQSRLLNLLTPRTILVGHSLNADLTAMKLTHPFIIDTSIIYPHPRGPPLKSALKFLAKKYLNREIQKHHGTTGHDSIEDATACLDLVKQKCEKGAKWGTSEASGESIFTRLSRHYRPGVAKEAGVFRSGARIDHSRKDHYSRGAEKVFIPCDDDEEVVGGVRRAVLGDDDGATVPGGGVDFTWARFRELETLRGWINNNRYSTSADPPAPEPSPTALASAVSSTVQKISSVHAMLPPCTLLIVYSGTGDPREMGRLQEMQRRFKREYAVKKWDELSVRWTDVEEQALRRACVRARQGIGLVTIT